MLKDKEIEDMLQKVIDLKVATPNFSREYDNFFENKPCYLLNDSLTGRDINLIYKKNKPINISSFSKNWSDFVKCLQFFPLSLKDNRFNFRFRYYTSQGGIDGTGMLNGCDSMSISVIYNVLFEKVKGSWILVYYDVHEEHFYNYFRIVRTLIPRKEGDLEKNINDNDWKEIIQTAINTKYIPKATKDYDAYFSLNDCYLVCDSLKDKKIDLLNRQGKKIKVIGLADLPKDVTHYIFLDIFNSFGNNQKVCSFEFGYRTSSDIKILKNTTNVKIIYNNIAEKLSTGLRISYPDIIEEYYYPTLTFGKPSFKK